MYRPMVYLPNSNFTLVTTKAISMILKYVIPTRSIPMQSSWPPSPRGFSYFQHTTTRSGLSSEKRHIPYFVLSCPCLPQHLVVSPESILPHWSTLAHVSFLHHRLSPANVSFRHTVSILYHQAPVERVNTNPLGTHSNVCAHVRLCVRE